MKVCKLALMCNLTRARNVKDFTEYFGLSTDFSKLLSSFKTSLGIFFHSRKFLL